jgi:translocation and assembly module TamA
MPAPATYHARSRPIASWAGWLLLALAAGACARGGALEDPGFERPATAVSYEVTLEGAPSAEITDLAEASLASYLLMPEGAPSFAFLRRRADEDVPVLLKILRSRGHYSATAEARVEETGPETARIVLTAEPGPAYTLIEHRLLITGTGAVAPPALDAAALGSPVGGPALAAEIARAEGAAVAELTNSGFPYARFESRKGLADPEAATLQVDSMIAAGAAFRFGAVRFEGVETVDEAYLLSYRPWDEGDTYDAEKLREFQHRLVGTGLFRAARLQPPETPPADGPAPAPLPIVATFEEAPPRSVSAGLRYDTDLGPSVRATFEHRNLFGANERLLAEAEVGLVEQRLGAGLRKPQFLRPGQDLLTDVTFARVDDDAFDSLSVTGFAGLERQLSEHWRAGLGGLAELSEIDDADEEGTATLLGAPFFAAFDSTNDLLDPVRGARLRLEATPFVGAFAGEDTEFLTLDGTGSVYLPLDGESRYVVAARGRMASILSPDLESIPPTRRLYSGGGGSIRGYAENFIGPLDEDDDPIGGRSALEGGVELRARLFGDIGGVVFAEAGSVSTAVFPDFEEGVQVAAGFGLRYHSIAGPIRVDLAFPVNGRGADDAWQLYFSIGQAF